MAADLDLGVGAHLAQVQNGKGTVDGQQPSAACWSDSGAGEVAQCVHRFLWSRPLAAHTIPCCLCSSCVLVTVVQDDFHVNHKGGTGELKD